MIYVDYRVGSRHLENILKARRLPVTVTTLRAGDVMFVGNGPQGIPMRVGIELKKVPDLVDSIHSGRLSGTQIPKMARQYARCWLLIQGSYHPDTWNAKYSEVERYRLSVEEIAGFRTRRVENDDEAGDFIKSVYAWWTSKEYEEHRSHLMIDRSDRQVIPTRERLRDFYAKLPDVGWVRAQRLVEAFPNPDALTDATRREFDEIKGLGPKTVAKIWKFLREGK